MKLARFAFTYANARQALEPMDLLVGLPVLLAVVLAVGMTWPLVLRTGEADPALGERVRLRRPERRADDLDALASEDVIEDFAELAVAIVDQETDRCQLFRE